MTEFRDEPLIQRKRKYHHDKRPILSNCFLNNSNDNPLKEDDYFLIGPSSYKFSPCIAYPNRFRYKTRSASPITIKNQIEHQATQTNSKKFTNKISNNKTLSKKSVHCQTNQTENLLNKSDPKNYLKLEIKRIRDNIEKQKQKLSNQSLDKTDKNVEKHHVYDTAQSKISNSKSVDPKRYMPLRNELKSYIEQDSFGNKPIMDESKQFKHQPRISEYQQAFKEPYLKKSKINRSKSHDIERGNHKSAIKSSYQTVYQCEYKPFKYVPIDKFYSNNVESNSNIHIIPYERQRPVSACGLRDFDQSNNKPFVNDHSRHVCLSASRAHSKHRFKSEYRTKYLNYYNLIYPSTTESMIKPKYDLSIQLNQLKQQAWANREKDRKSHFSREHLVQLESNFVDFWDRLSDSLIISNDNNSNNDEDITKSLINQKDVQKFKQILEQPIAGKPSNYLGNFNYKKIIRSDQLKNKCLNSINLNRSTTISSSPIGHHQNQKFPVYNQTSIKSYDPLDITSFEDENFNNYNICNNDENIQSTTSTFSKNQFKSSSIDCCCSCSSPRSVASSLDMEQRKFSHDLANQTLERAKQNHKKLVSNSFDPNFYDLNKDDKIYKKYKPHLYTHQPYQEQHPSYLIPNVCA